MNARVDVPPATPSENPLRAIQRVGTRASREGFYIGAILAIVFHLTALESPRYSHIQMRMAVANMRAGLHDYFWSTYNVDLVQERAKPEEEKAEEENEEPEPEPEPPPPDPETPEPQIAESPEPIPEDAEQAEEDIYESIPPAAAEAADVMTSDVKDLTSFTISDKDGSRSSGGGYTAGDGTAKNPVHDRRARANGEGKGKGDGKVRRPAKRKKRDLSRQAMPTSGSAWNDCGFPPQADLEQIDHAVAMVSVTVGPDGRPIRARVISDPGYGFGALARTCAMTKRYRAGLDADGKPITQDTPPLRVIFTR